MAGFGAVGENSLYQEPQPHPRRGLNLTVTPGGDRACHTLPCQALGQGNWTDRIRPQPNQCWLELEAWSPEAPASSPCGGPFFDPLVPSSSVNSH